ncbi:hypothetical protein [Thiothrix subterranea]|uniref:hypothetical protein n=1 Tax=Thiothrix subterranea TaxID=2735563 RepID=UPI00280A7E91|nr:hypothetical protein [Thiothrix subterranea]
MSDLVFYYHNRLPCAAFTVLETAIKEHGEHELISTFDEFRVDQYVLADSATSRIIAIDFDNTITADPDFYLALIKRYRESGWNRSCVLCAMTWMITCWKSANGFRVTGCGFTPPMVEKNGLSCFIRESVSDCGLMIIFQQLSRSARPCLSETE